MNKITKILFFALLGTLFITAGCVKKDFDTPPSNCDSLQNVTANITIAELKAMLPVAQDTMQITDSLIIEGYVISTDQYGNFYKELVIEDTSAGIDIKIDRSYLYTYYPLGQRMLINLKGMYLTKEKGVIKLGGEPYQNYGYWYAGRLEGDTIIDAHIQKTCENQMPAPILLTIPEAKNDQYLYMYVKFENVEFPDNELGTTWADAVNNSSVNHNLVDALANTIIVRTSGYASFAGDTIPSGSGTFIGILGKYNTDYQVYINHPDELDMTGDRF